MGGEGAVAALGHSSPKAAVQLVTPFRTFEPISPRHESRDSFLHSRMFTTSPYTDIFRRAFNDQRRWKYSHD